MYRSVASASLLGLCAFSLAASAEFLPNEVLVRARPGVPRSLALSAIRGRVISEIPKLGVYRVRLTGGQRVEQATSLGKNSRLYSYIEPNYVGQYHRNPNDPLFSTQYGPQRVRLPQAWDIFIGEPSTLVAVLDSGFRPTHEDLVGNMSPLSRAFDNSGNLDDNVGHGTHVGGIAAGSTNNGRGIAGGGWNVRLLALKLGNVPTAEASAAALIFAADNGAKVASMSYGRSALSQVEQDAVNYAFSRGVLPIASAGNNGNTELNFPAACENVLAVAASDQNDNKADFSTFGNWVHVTAPGVDILAPFTASDTDYQQLSGTSMSCPLVSGVAGLLFSYAPQSTPSEIRQALEDTCVPVPGNYVIFGRIDAVAAMNTLVPPIPFESGPDTAGVLQTNVSEGTIVGNPSGASTANLVSTQDGVSVTVSSIFQRGVGHITSLTADVPFAHNLADLIKTHLSLTAQVTSRTSVLFFAHNKDTASWQSLGSGSLIGTSKTLDVAMPADLTPFIQNGKIKIAIRSIFPSRLPGGSYTLRVDKLNISGIKKAPRNN